MTQTTASESDPGAHPPAPAITPPETGDSNLEQQKFTRQEEASADLTGVQIAMSAGYKPEALIELFKRLTVEGTMSDNKLLGYMSDHPLPADRIDAIKKEITRLRQVQKKARIAAHKR